jgi:hypothetical protein
LIIDGKVPTHKYYGPPEIVEDRLNFWGYDGRVDYNKTR